MNKLKQIIFDALFRPKRYSVEQTANLIMGDTLPSDTEEDFDDLSSSASHLSTESESDSFSESSETDEDHNEATGQLDVLQFEEECVLEVETVLI